METFYNRSFRLRVHTAGLKRAWLFCLVFIPWLVQAQLGVGQWRTHFSYTTLQSVEESASQVFALGMGSLYSYDPSTQELSLYTRLNGLSDNSVSMVRYHAERQQMMVIYTNSNIDLITSGDIYNLPDIYLKPIIGSKQINDVFFAGNQAYLSAECGLIVVNLLKNEITDTYDLGLPIKSCAVTDKEIFVCTSAGIWRGDRKSNLLDKTNWKKQNDMVATRAVIYQGSIVAFVANQGLWRMDPADSQWKPLNSRSASKGHKAYSDRMIEFTSEAVYLYKSLSQPPTEIKLARLVDVSYRNNDHTLWCISSERGLSGYRLTENSDQVEPLVEQIAPQGPASNSAFAGLYDRGTTYFITSGPMFIDLQGTKAQVMQFSDDNRWYNLPQSEVSKEVGFNFVDVLSIAVNPSDASSYFVSTWYHGVLQFKNNKVVKNYHARNSGLEGVYGPDGYCWVNGLAFDRQNNLWMLNSGVPNVVKVLKADSTWSSLYFAPITKIESIDRLLILKHTPGEHKWVISRRVNKGVLIFDDRGTIDNTSDDRSVFFNSFVDQDNKSVPATTYSCMVEDRSGVVWVGSNRGPLIFTSPSKAFEGAFYCTRIKVPRNDGTNLADYLLENEDISCIAVDGANRKWMGTSSSGVYLVSADGLETIHHFTAQNSPLPSNTLLSVTVHPHTGEVFFGTAAGLVSYRSDATEPKEDFSEIKAFPNPVRPGYSGPISITGLEEDSQVKIMNSGGQLVFQGRSLGGQISWNGQDGTGQRVRTGVYLVFCTNADGSEKMATKIVVVN